MRDMFTITNLHGKEEKIELLLDRNHRDREYRFILNDKNIKSIDLEPLIKLSQQVNLQEINLSNNNLTALDLSPLK